jgi:hypothetical protein
MKKLIKVLRVAEFANASLVGPRDPGSNFIGDRTFS